MGSSAAREYLVTLAGVIIGVLLIISTTHQVRLGRRFPSASGRLHPVEALARLVLGACLLLLALFLLAGRTLWSGAVSTAVPAWATPVGVAIFAGVLLSAVVAGAFALARRLQSGPR
jgi:hypothetical protein